MTIEKNFCVPFQNSVLGKSLINSGQMETDLIIGGIETGLLGAGIAIGLIIGCILIIKIFQLFTYREEKKGLFLEKRLIEELKPLILSQPIWNDKIPSVVYSARPGEREWTIPAGTVFIPEDGSLPTASQETGELTWPGADRRGELVEHQGGKFIMGPGEYKYIVKDRNGNERHLILKPAGGGRTGHFFREEFEFSKYGWRSGSNNNGSGNTGSGNNNSGSGNTGSGSNTGSSNSGSGNTGSNPGTNS